MRTTILAAVLTLLWPAWLLEAKPKAPKDNLVDVATQLKLKRRLLKDVGKGGLAKTLAHVQEEWESLTPDQRRQFRRQALAFLHKTDEQQEDLLRRYDKLIEMTAERREKYRQRAKWLAAVVKWLEENDPDRIDELKQMRPLDRAGELIELRDKLVRENKISPQEPATRPADEPSEPASRPAPSTSETEPQQK
ncbi:MAG: DUF3106 domain-containing protein [Planctomycetota bacterium]